MSSRGAHPFFVAGSRLKYFSGAVCNIKRCCEKEQTVQRKNTNGGASIHKRCSEMFSKLKQYHKKSGVANEFFCKKHKSRVIFRDFPCI